MIVKQRKCKSRSQLKGKNTMTIEQVNGNTREPGSPIKAHVPSAIAKSRSTNRFAILK